MGPRLLPDEELGGRGGHPLPVIAQALKPNGDGDDDNDDEDDYDDVEVDDVEIITKSKQWMDKIDTLEKNVKSLPLEKGKEMISRLKDQLKNYRKSGLEKDEMSLENLVYKFLRRRGYLEKLIDLPTKLETKKLSVEKETIESKE